MPRRSAAKAPTLGHTAEVSHRQKRWLVLSCPGFRKLSLQHVLVRKALEVAAPVAVQVERIVLGHGLDLGSVCNNHLAPRIPRWAGPRAARL